MSEVAASGSCGVDVVWSVRAVRRCLMWMYARRKYSYLRGLKFSSTMVCTCAGVQAGDQGSGVGMSGYSSNGPLYEKEDKSYRVNAGVRPGPAGAQFPYGPPGVQPAMRGGPVGGHFGSHAQYQGPPMNPSGTL